MRRVAAAFVLLLSSVLPAGELKDPNARTMEGLKRFTVLVEEIGPGGKDIGLSRELLKADAREALGRTHVVLVDVEESPYLYVMANVMRLTSGSINYAYSVRVAMYERSILERDKSMHFNAVTWTQGTLGVASSDRVLSAVRGSVKEQVGRFADDYLAVNRP
jgi:hypothetical protein